MDEVYLTPKEAAHLMGVHYTTMYRWLRTGVLLSIRKGERLLYVPQSEVLRVKRVH